MKIGTWFHSEDDEDPRWSWETCWTAKDLDDPNSPVGYGAIEDEAVRDLRRKLAAPPMPPWHDDELEMLAEILEVNQSNLSEIGARLSRQVALARCEGRLRPWFESVFPEADDREACGFEGGECLGGSNA